MHPYAPMRESVGQSASSATTAGSTASSGPARGLPNFVIAGVNKAGTTSLFTYMAAHPCVCASSIKETGFFLPMRYSEQMGDLDAYRALFAHAADRPVRMEATPGYFYGGAPLAERMKRDLGLVRVLIVLRDPTDRLISFFEFMKSRLLLPQDMTLRAYVDACARLDEAALRQRANNPFFGLEGGHYSRYLPCWQLVFGDNLRVCFFDELRSDPKGLLRRLCTWNALDPAFVEQLPLDVENKTVGFQNRSLHRLALGANASFESLFRRHPQAKRLLRGLYYRLNGRRQKPPIDPQVVAELRSHYAPWNTELGAQLGGATAGSLPAWLAGDMA